MVDRDTVPAPPPPTNAAQTALNRERDLLRKQRDRAVYELREARRKMAELELELDLLRGGYGEF